MGRESSSATVAAMLADRAARAALRAMVRAYRRYLSPRKGFRCAHAALHGGPTCSAFALHALAEPGLSAGLGSVRDRLAACSEAARLLRAAPTPNPRVIDGCGAEGCLGGDDGGTASAAGSRDCSPGAASCLADIFAAFAPSDGRRRRDSR